MSKTRNARQLKAPTSRQELFGRLPVSSCSRPHTDSQAQMTPPRPREGREVASCFSLSSAWPTITSWPRRAMRATWRPRATDVRTTCVSAPPCRGRGACRQCLLRCAAGEAHESRQSTGRASFKKARSKSGCVLGPAPKAYKLTARGSGSDETACVDDVKLGRIGPGLFLRRRPLESGGGGGHAPDADANDMASCRMSIDAQDLSSGAPAQVSNPQKCESAAPRGASMHMWPCLSCGRR